MVIRSAAMVAVALVFMPMRATAQENRGIGYPSVTAALEALRARSDVNMSVRDGWTIINDPAASTLWSFTPPGHPAHPAAVKRMVIERDGKLFLQMQALCQASKSVCDRLIADFQALNEDIGKSVRGKTESKQEDQWRPTAEQEQLIEQQTYAYFSARDSRLYKEGYALLSLSQQKTISFDQWVGRLEKFNSQAGNIKSWRIKKVTWYKDPPGAPVPGVYVAADFVSEFLNIETHCGYIVWHQQPDGVFKVVREEENFIDKATQQKLAQSDLDTFRKQFRC